MNVLMRTDKVINRAHRRKADKELEKALRILEEAEHKFYYHLFETDADYLWAYRKGRELYFMNCKYVASLKLQYYRPDPRFWDWMFKPKENPKR